MRKFILASSVILSALFLSSCMGRPGRDGRDGLNGLDGLGQMNTIMIDVPESSWAYSDTKDNNFYVASYTFKTGEMTEEIFDKGVVKMYRIYNWDNQDACQIEMPYVLPAEWYNKSDGYYYSFVETVNYELYLDEIRFFYRASDFAYTEEFNPGFMQFRCVIMY